MSRAEPEEEEKVGQSKSQLRRKYRVRLGRGWFSSTSRNSSPAGLGAEGWLPCRIQSTRSILDLNTGGPSEQSIVGGSIPVLGTDLGRLTTLLKLGLESNALAGHMVGPVCV